MTPLDRHQGYGRARHRILVEQDTAAHGHRSPAAAATGSENSYAEQTTDAVLAHLGNPATSRLVTSG
jgi:hypothetical protein